MASREHIDMQSEEPHGGNTLILCRGVLLCHDSWTLITHKADQSLLIWSAAWGTMTRERQN